MEIDDKLELIARAICGEIKIEVYAKNLSDWYTLDYYEDGEFHTYHVGTWSIGYLMENNIRKVKKLPLLSQDECDFLEWFPQRWWLTRDKDGKMVAHLDKPFKNICAWTSQVSEKIPFHPAFIEIKWSDEDCYTIGELIAHAQEENK